MPERKKREADFEFESITDTYEGEELLKARADRAAANPAWRIALIETDVKDLRKKVSATREDVAGMRGELKSFLSVVESERKLAHQTEHVRLGNRARIIIAVVGAVVAIITAVITRLAS